MKVKWKTYFLRKTASLLIVAFGVTIFSFAFASFSSVDQAEAIAYKNNRNPTQEQIEAIRAKYGYDKPIYIQYFVWLKNSLRGDLGIATTTNNYVFDDIKNKLPATIQIVLLAIVWVLMMGIPLGILCAKYKNSIFDHITRFATIVGMSIPTFWLGFLLLIEFAVKLSIFKVVDYGSLKSLILPSLTIAVPVACQIIRILRANLINELSCDYIVYAKTRGLTDRWLFLHALKNALSPVVTLLFQSLGYFVAGNAIVETVFSWPGLGAHLVSAVMGRDIMTINGCVLVLAVIFVICNLLADMICAKLNPQLRIGGIADV